MSTLELKELSAPAGEVIKIAAGKTLDLNSQGTLVLPTIPATKMPTGSVLQVQYMSIGGNVTNTSSTYADTGVNVSITPSSTSSKILVFANMGSCGSNVHVNAHMSLQMLRGSAAIHVFEGEGGYNASTLSNSFGAAAGMKLDSPSTTSSINYKIQMKNKGNAGSVFINGSGGYSSITLMEIQG